jgi:hypothetical protein
MLQPESECARYFIAKPDEYNSSKTYVSFEEIVSFTNRQYRGAFRFEYESSATLRQLQPCETTELPRLTTSVFAQCQLADYCQTTVLKTESDEVPSAQ